MRPCEVNWRMWKCHAKSQKLCKLACICMYNNMLDAHTWHTQCPIDIQLKLKLCVYPLEILFCHDNYTIHPSAMCIIVSMSLTECMWRMTGQCDTCRKSHTHMSFMCTLAWFIIIIWERMRDCYMHTVWSSSRNPDWPQPCMTKFKLHRNSENMQCYQGCVA